MEDVPAGGAGARRKAFLWRGSEGGRPSRSGPPPVRGRLAAGASGGAGASPRAFAGKAVGCFTFGSRPRPRSSPGGGRIPSAAQRGYL